MKEQDELENYFAAIRLKNKINNKNLNASASGGDKSVKENT
jgi:hypothetical protein